MQIVDLTHPFVNGMPVYPGLPEPTFRTVGSVPIDGYVMTELHLLNHIGTHVDAPAHRIAGGDTLEDMPLERFVTHALTINVADRVPGPLPLAELEPQLHHLHAGDILFLCSDNARNWGTEAYWTGWSYPDVECAHALVDTGISAIGFDGPSAGPVPSTTLDLHRLWLSSGRMIIVNVANLTALPARAQVVVAPIRLAHGDGAPARVFALVPDEYSAA